MTDYRILEGQYLAPTPAGAYLAASQPGGDAARRFILRLLGQARSPDASASTVARLAGGTPEDAGELLHRLQSLALVQGFAEPLHAPEGAFDDLLPPLLSHLSGSGRCVLADSQGFYLAASGFAHETAEELSALAADLASLDERHARFLRGNLSMAAGGWGLLDASGNGQLGFWPLHLGKHTFILAIGGVPRFNTPEFVSVAWALARRYAPEAS